jgi:xanthine dehydrogenase accessory factor
VLAFGDDDHPRRKAQRRVKLSTSSACYAVRGPAVFEVRLSACSGEVRARIDMPVPRGDDQVVALAVWRSEQVAYRGRNSGSPRYRQAASLAEVPLDIDDDKRTGHGGETSLTVGLAWRAVSDESGPGEVATFVRRELSAGHELAVGRVTDVEGFSTLSEGAGVIFAVGAAGAVEPSAFGVIGQDRITDAARSLLAAGSPSELVVVEVGDKEAVAAGLACGGRVSLMLQPASLLPSEFWDLLAARAPVALVSWLHGRPASVMAADGRSFGAPLPEDIASEARLALTAGGPSRRWISHEAQRALLETWVPEPRLVVVGGGELLDALAAQAGLLGWEVRGCAGGAEELDELLGWAGMSGALIVLSHDPHVDVPALAAGLARGVSYVGALGSRSTQSRRTAQLAQKGVAEADVARIHRPIGLDLGGRRAAEVALAIVAEILACRNGRSAKPLRELTGSIH